MATTAGALSLVSKTSTTASLESAAASAGTAPYSYQWYRSTTSGFTPGAGNIIAGATALTLNDTGLIPGTQYYYKVVATDSSGTPVTGTSAQLGVETDPPVQNPNQFAQSSLLGMLDLRFNNETVAAQIDSSESETLYAGQAVKIVDSADGIPKVIACTADSDEVFGFINYNIKDIGYEAGDRCEISQAGNVMYLYATGAIARGAQVTLDVTTRGGVATKTSSSGDRIVGYAFDKASAAGALIRVKLGVPSFAVA